jgi:single-strand DNA-binding protein
LNFKTKHNMAVNKVILVGNVGKDPETRYLDENTPVCKFPLATSEVYKNRDGEKIEQTEWHNIVLWRGLAKVAEQYVKKGAQLFIEGRIRSRSYDDKDGIKRYITEIVGDNMQMLGRRQENDQQQDSGSGYQQDSGSSQQQGNSQQGSSPQGSNPQYNDQQQSRPQSPGNQQPQSSSSAGGADPDIDGPGNEPDDLPF